MKMSLWMKMVKWRLSTIIEAIMKMNYQMKPFNKTRPKWRGQVKLRRQGRSRIQGSWELKQKVPNQIKIISSIWTLKMSNYTLRISQPCERQKELQVLQGYVWCMWYVYVCVKGISTYLARC